MALTAGQIVNNRYRIARMLGRGGMGAVYRAWDLALNVPVALKELVPEPGIDAASLAQLRAQFRREAQVLAALHHPNLPRVTDHFEWGGNAYLVMDFIDGESLDALIARQGPLPERQVVNWANQLLDALATCHAHRIVHRDIKPQNIIIRTDGRAMLVDFGLVKLWDPLHPQTQHIVRHMGTPEYASPEQFYLLPGRHTEPRSDLYSLGATLYHALTGQRPPSAIERWTQPSSLIPPRRWNASIQPQIEAIILRAMELDPDRRFGGAREMQAALHAAAGIGTPTGPWTTSPIRPGADARPPVSSVATPRTTHWGLEMLTAMGMALVGVLTIQAALFADIMTPDLYLGRSISALLVGGLGWFLGDLIFQALARPEHRVGSAGGSRPTQRLVAFTRRLTRRLTTAQQVALLALLLACTAFLVWSLGPVVANMPFVTNYLSLYALIGPIVYAATGRRPGRALVAHTLVVTLANALLAARMPSPDVIGTGSVFLAAAGGGLLMEALAFLAERLLLHS